MAYNSHRERIYRKYASDFQDMGPIFDINAAHRWGRAYDYYLREWLPKEKDAAIADIACGSGRFLYFLKERGYSNAQGVDISAEQVALARQATPNVKQEDAITYLENRGESFHLIVALDFIEHLMKDELFRFLKAAFNSLLEGGRLVLQTPNASSPFFGEVRYGDISHQICFNSTSIRRLLALQGFIDIEIRETHPVPWGYSLASSVRHLGWRLIGNCVKGWNLIEVGSKGSGIFTRNMIASARKR